MNILFLADPNSIHDIKWITFFSKRHNCHLISRNTPNHSPNENFSKFNINYLGNIRDYSTLKFWKNAKEASKLEGVIKLHKIDVFHILYTEPNVLWANYKHIFKIPIIASNRGSDILVTINNTFKSKSLLNNLVSKRYKSAFAQCNWITCTSHSQIEIIKTLNLNQNITLIRTGIDIRLIDAISKNRICNEVKKPYVLFPRNMRPVYNHELALEAIKKLPNSVKSNHEFVFIDADSSDVEYVNKIRSIISSIKGTRVHFLDKLAPSKLMPLVKNATLAVMTNLSDGSPVSAMEAMYLKTPLILSPLKYDTALFGQIEKFNEFNSSVLAKKIISMLEHKPSLDNLHLNKELIINIGNRGVEMNKIENLYNQCINKKQ